MCLFQASTEIHLLRGPFSDTSETDATQVCAALTRGQNNPVEKSWPFTQSWENWRKMKAHLSFWKVSLGVCERATACVEDGNFQELALHHMGPGLKPGCQSWLIAPQLPQLPQYNLICTSYQNEWDSTKKLIWHPGPHIPWALLIFDSLPIPLPCPSNPLLLVYLHPVTGTHVCDSLQFYCLHHGHPEARCVLISWTMAYRLHLLFATSFISLI